MKTFNKELVGLLLFTTLFYVLFWDQFWGLNILLLSIATGAILFWFNPYALVLRSVQLIYASNLLCAVGVFWHNSIFTHFIYIISFILLIGKSQYPNLSQFFFLGIAGVFNYFISFFKAFKVISDNLAIIPGYKKYHHWIIILILPLIISSVFLALYCNANEAFNKLTFQFFDWIYKNLKTVIDLLSIPKLFFLLFGFGIGASLLLRFKAQFIDRFENKLVDDIERKAWNKFWGTTSVNGLKSFYRMALVSFIMVNIMLLCVNILDIIHVWFNFEPSAAPDLRQFVHTGTYILIFSVFVAIGMVLYFFYGNINFYKQNRWVKTLAYVWIGQNMLMVVSVLIRNLYYIQLYGLAYKRLGVFFFLIATILALVFLIIKVKEHKSVSYYLRTVSITAYCVLLFVAQYNWDILIANYNLNYNRKNLDKTFLLYELSDNTLPILWKNRDAFGDSNGDDYQQLLKRIQRFQKRAKSDTWKSTNIMRVSNARFFLKNSVPQPKFNKYEIFDVD